MRILVTGSRTWIDRNCICRALEAVVTEFDAWHEPDEYGNTLPKNVTLIHGGCPTGADSIADDWAISSIVNIEVHRADWTQVGRRAGPIRNLRMVHAGADICLAFIKDESRGATHCAGVAERNGISTRRWTE